MIGPNGAGKTTTVETIVGINRKASGSIMLMVKISLAVTRTISFKKGCPGT